MRGPIAFPTSGLSVEAVVLRDWCSQLLAGDPLTLARRYCRQLASCTGVDETAIWQWGFLEQAPAGAGSRALGGA
jgi:streptomycin 6-kinase